MAIYKNAENFLPDELLKQIQEFIQGELVYIPQAKKNRRAWGEKSGYREVLQNRNKKICNQYREGKTIHQLAHEFYLSIDSIKKIIYTN